MNSNSGSLNDDSNKAGYVFVPYIPVQKMAQVEVSNPEYYLKKIDAKLYGKIDFKNNETKK